MKKIFIFALMTMAASSSFAISDLLNCNNNGPVNVSTSIYANDERIHLTTLDMVDDSKSFHSIVNSKSHFFKGLKTFTGRTDDGRNVQLIVQNSNPLSATLKVSGQRDIEGFVCIKQPLFPL